MRKFLLLSGFLLMVLFAFNSCGDDDVTTCDHCPSSTPYSIIGSTNCYVSLEECEFFEGKPCEICF